MRLMQSPSNPRRTVGYPPLLPQKRRSNVSRKWSQLYVECGCGKIFPRGMISDYEIECECGKIVRVQKYEPTPTEEK